MFYNLSLPFVYLIYKYMGISLLISGIVAFIVASTPALLRIFFSNPIIALIVQLAPIFYVFSFVIFKWTIIYFKKLFIS